MRLAHVFPAKFPTASANIVATIIVPRLHHARSWFVVSAATTTVLNARRVQSRCVASIAPTTARNALLARMDRSHLVFPVARERAAMMARLAVAKELIAATGSNDSTAMPARAKDG